MSTWPYILGGVALVGLASSASGKSKSDNNKSSGGQERETLARLARETEALIRWPGLSAFLDIFAQQESAWHFRPNGEVAKPGKNDAVGPYQIRPTSAGDGKEDNAVFLANPALLQDPAIATAAIVDFLADIAKGDRGATWSDLRAAGAFPTFINGRPRVLDQGLANATSYKTLASQQKRYDDAVRRFRSLAKGKIPVDGQIGGPSNPMEFAALLKAIAGRKLR